MTEIKSQIFPTDLLAAVSHMAKDFRTGYQSPGLQLHEIEKAQKSLRKLELQIRWWHRTREFSVSSYAFEFLAEHMDGDKFIAKQHACCASEQIAVKELVKAKVLIRKGKGWVMNEI